MNKVILIGNLTRDPEVTTTGTGITVCKFGIAVNRNFKNANGEYDTDFFNIVAWRGLGENCGKFLSKGLKIAVVGRIETRNYEKDGVKHFAIDIVADDVEFLSPKGSQDTSGGNYSGGGASHSGGSSGYSGGSKKSASSGELKPIDDEGLPF